MPGEENTRIQLVGDGNPRIGLIILEEHVVAGLVLLYHRVLEVEGVLFGGHDDIAHVGDIAHEQVGAEYVVGAVEIRRHSPFQVLGLADVYDRPGGVIICIDAGGVGKKRYFLA